MARSVVLDTNGYQYCLGIFGSIATFIISMVFMIELFRNINTFKKNKMKRIHSYYFISQLLIYLCYIINGVSNIIVWFKLSEHCAVFDLIVILSYVLSKLFLYEFFILRLHVIYTKSCFQYNVKILLFLAIFIVIYILVTMILMIINFKSAIIHNNIINECYAFIPFYIHVYGALFDQFVTFTAVYLFLKPLIHLIKAGDNTNTSISEREYSTIVKIAALSFIASVTTFLVLIFQVIVFENWLLFVVDQLINVICISLMDCSYSNIYRLICCLTNKLCRECIICICCLQSHIQSNKTQQKMSAVVNSTESQKSTNTDSKIPQSQVSFVIT